MHVQTCKKNCGVQFLPFQNLYFFNKKTKSTPQNFCKLSLNLILVITIFLDKKYGVTNLVSKIDAIDGKKWVKFVAMQQNNAT